MRRFLLPILAIVGCLAAVAVWYVSRNSSSQLLPLGQDETVASRATREAGGPVRPSSSSENLTRDLQDPTARTQSRPKPAGVATRKSPGPATVLPFSTKERETADPTSVPSTAHGPAPIPPALNPQVRSVVEAISTGAHPERLTSSLKPKPFNKTEYDANPRSYLDVCEPGRIWDVAEAGPNVKQIDAKMDTVVDMKPGESARLQVIAVPRAPVTFTSFDWGEFQNRLTSITVQADSNGRASAVFTATPGTIGQVDILAASPLTSGQVKFHIEIK